MDHDTQLSKMDPKLKEAYERVMGTSGSMPHDAPPANPPPLSEQTSPPAPSLPTPTEPHVAMPPVTAAQHPGQTPHISEPPLRRSIETVHVQAPQRTGHDVHPTRPVPGKKKSTISPILITILLVVFFAVYTFVWIKILNVPLPFLQ